VLEAGRDLHYRDFLTVALVVPKSAGSPTTGSTSRDRREGRPHPELRVVVALHGQRRPTCLGLEYFVFEGDDVWASSDEDLVELATRELAALGSCRPVTSRLATWCGSQGLSVLRLRVPLQRGHDLQVPRHEVPNVHPVGRNGMHKYNNQDHSMYTAMLTVENILGAGHDIWAVNVEEEYHEEHSDGQGERAAQTSGTGRDRPDPPRRNS